MAHTGVDVILKTRVFTLCVRNYKNLSELAGAMDISVSQVYRVLEGKRNINRKFIIGAMKAFPGYKFDDLFYFVPEAPVGHKSAARRTKETTGRQSLSLGRG
jgi:hypothetical protein